MVFDSSPGSSGSGDSSPSSSSGPPLKLIGAVVVVIAIGVLAVALASGGGGGGDGRTAALPSRTAESGGLATDSVPTVEATLDLNRATPVATPGHLETVGAGDRLIIGKFNVAAPMAVKKVGPDGVMPDPATPDEVAYYDFSSWPGLGGAPGKGGNTVVSGHVDSGSKACKNGTVPAPCQAVFWELRNLKIGDEVQLSLGGKTFRYKVATNEPVAAGDNRWHQIVSSTAQESLTIITCGGQFNPATREYDLRTVVTATLIPA